MQWGKPFLRLHVYRSIFQESGKFIQAHHLRLLENVFLLPRNVQPRIDKVMSITATHKPVSSNSLNSNLSPAVSLNSHLSPPVCQLTSSSAPLLTHISLSVSRPILFTASTDTLTSPVTSPSCRFFCFPRAPTLL